MKYILKPFTACLITLTLAGGGLTQIISEAVAEHVPRITVVGDLVSVDAKAGTVAVKAKGRELSLTAGTKAAVETLEKFKAGDKVRVFYTEADGNFLV